MGQITYLLSLSADSAVSHGTRQALSIERNLNYNAHSTFFPSLPLLASCALSVVHESAIAPPSPPPIPVH